MLGPTLPASGLSKGLDGIGAVDETARQARAGPRFRS